MLNTVMVMVFVVWVRIAAVVPEIAEHAQGLLLVVQELVLMVDITTFIVILIVVEEGTVGRTRNVALLLDVFRIVIVPTQT